MLHLLCLPESPEATPVMAAYGTIELSEAGWMSADEVTIAATPQHYCDRGVSHCCSCSPSSGSKGAKPLLALELLPVLILLKTDYSR